MHTFKNQARFLKLLYFVSFVAIGFSVTFSTIFYKHTLLNPDGTTADHLIGWIFFVMPLVGVLANIPVGILADKLHAGRHIITLCCFGLALFSIALGAGGTELAATFGLWPKFIYIFCILVFYNAFFQPIIPTLDAQTMILLNEHSSRDNYGPIRVWGTLGWSVSAIAMGTVLWFFYYLPIIFYASAVVLVVMGFISYRTVRAVPPKPPIDIPWHHLRNDHLFLWFLVFSFLNGIINTSSFLYTGYFFDNVMKSPFEMGLIFGTWTLFEIPILFYSRRLIQRLGNRKLLILGLLINGIRLVLFSMFTLETPFLYKWAAATLQGAAFGFLHLGSMDFVDRRSHNDMRNTYMNVANVARMTIASAVGGKLGATIIAAYGADSLMKFCGIGSIGLILFFVIFVRESSPARES